MTIIEELKAWGCSPDKLPTQFFAVLADNINDVYSASHADIAAELRADLEHLVNIMLESSPELVPLLTSSDSETKHRLAYQIGQINFAQRLAASQAEHKLKNEFIQEAQSDQYAEYLRLLAEKDHKNSELIDLLKHSPETISRKLKTLRGWGLTDFRRDGKQVINFLTKAGRIFVKENRENTNDNKSSADFNKVLNEMKDSSSPEFKDHKSFAIA